MCVYSVVPILIYAAYNLKIIYKKKRRKSLCCIVGMIAVFNLKLMIIIYKSSDTKNDSKQRQSSAHRTFEPKRLCGKLVLHM